MRDFTVLDIEFSSIQKNQYDLALLMATSEDRCALIAKSLTRSQVLTTLLLQEEIVLHEDTHASDEEARIALRNNREQIQKSLDTQTCLIPSDDESQLYGSLEDVGSLRDEELHVLVDYSSMPRSYYAAILNWATYSNTYRRVIIDFAYSVSSHKPVGPPLAITAIRALPGCDGSTVPGSNSVAVFGLGFDGIAAMAVLERLEPDVLYTYFASPGAFPHYPQKTRNENDTLMQYHSKSNVAISLFSVGTSFVRLAELVSPHRNREDITIVPMGPKPHVLAALLLAMKFRDVSCLHVSGQDVPPRAQGMTGDIIATRVVFDLKEGA